jgi:hypothetical protein
MPGKRIIWKLFFAQTLLILISIAIIGLYAGFSFKDYYTSQITSQLESNAILIRGLAKEDILKEKGALGSLPCYIHESLTVNLISVREGQP